MHAIALCVIPLLIPGSLCASWSTWGSPKVPCNPSCMREYERRCQGSGYVNTCPMSNGNQGTVETKSEECKDGEGTCKASWTNWSMVGMCSVTCGDGTGMRSRSCTAPQDIVDSGLYNPVPPKACGDGDLVEPAAPCNQGACPVNGGWGTWAAWSVCAGGTRRRMRVCDRPAASNGGADCTGDGEETETCVVPISAVNGGWGTWGAWSACAGGSRRRMRVCDRPAASNGGADCAGASEETETCAVPIPAEPQASLAPGLAIHGGWSDWNEWGNCSEGTKPRNRTCDNPLPSNGGVMCPGEAKKDKNCACVSSPCLYNSTCYPRGRRDYYCSCVEKGVRTKECEPDTAYEKVIKYVEAGLITVSTFIGLAYLALCLFECWEFWPREEDDPVDWDYIKAYFRDLILGEDDPTNMVAYMNANPAPEGQQIVRGSASNSTVSQPVVEA